MIQIALFSILLILVAYMYSLYKEFNNKKLQELEKKLKFIQSNIDTKVIELCNINDLVERRKFTDVGLSKIESDCLDVYDLSSIKIPIEIIEDLHNMKLDDEEEIFKFIESQRYFWKLENTKKPFKRSKQK